MKKKKKALALSHWPLTLLALLLVSLLGLNTFASIRFPNPETQAKAKMFSLSAGERLYGRLRLWRLFAFSDNWSEAHRLENQIDPPTLAILKSQFDPKDLRIRLNKLAFLKNKTADDWVEIAKIYSRLGNLSQSQSSLDRAHELDPIRPDIERLYYSLAASPTTPSLSEK